MATSDRSDDIGLDALFRAIYDSVGVKFEALEFLRWRVIDDRLFPRYIRTVGELVDELHDGRYHLHLENVAISDLEVEPVEIANVDIELILEDGDWTYSAIHTDQETFWGHPDEQPLDLEKRLRTRYETISERLTRVFNLVKLIREIAISGR